MDSVITQELMRLRGHIGSRTSPTKTTSKISRKRGGKIQPGVMYSETWKNTVEFMHSYAKKVVAAIEGRIYSDRLVDSGELLISIGYRVLMVPSFQILFTIGDGDFKYGSGLPSEYGVYQDQGTWCIKPHYFFSAPVPGLTSDVYAAGMEAAMAKDVERQIAAALDKA